MTTTADYSITMRDGQGRTTSLFINGASVDQLVATGMPEWQAREDNESNAFANAVARDEIGADAWVI